MIIIRGFLLQTPIMLDRVMPYNMVSTFSNRIIVHGREIISCIVPGSAQPFNFKENFHLTEEEVNMSQIHFSLVHLCT